MGNNPSCQVPTESSNPNRKQLCLHLKEAALAAPRLNNTLYHFFVVWGGDGFQRNLAHFVHVYKYLISIQLQQWVYMQILIHHRIYLHSINSHHFRSRMEKEVTEWLTNVGHDPKQAPVVNNTATLLMSKVMDTPTHPNVTAAQTN